MSSVKETGAAAPKTTLADAKKAALQGKTKVAPLPKPDKKATKETPKDEGSTKVVKPTKEEKVKKEKAPKAEKAPKVPGISDYLKEIMVPASGDICAVTFGEANKLVKLKFPERKQLYASEFDRNFNILVLAGKIKSKKPTEFKIKEEKPAKEVKAKESKVEEKVEEKAAAPAKEKASSKKKAAVKAEEEVKA